MIDFLHYTIHQFKLNGSFVRLEKKPMQKNTFQMSLVPSNLQYYQTPLYWKLFLINFSKNHKTKWKFHLTHPQGQLLKEMVKVLPSRLKTGNGFFCCSIFIVLKISFKRIWEHFLEMFSSKIFKIQNFNENISLYKWLACSPTLTGAPAFSWNERAFLEPKLKKNVGWKNERILSIWAGRRIFWWLHIDFIV